MCCRLNLPAADVDRELQCVIEQMNDDSIEALSCEEGTDVSLDEFLVASSPWDAANMAIRFLSWDGASPSPESSGRSKDPLPPPLAKDDAFDVILGSEILYEEQHAWQVPNLLRQRLAHGGRCLIAGAVRENVVPVACVDHSCMRVSCLGDLFCLRVQVCGTSAARFETRLSASR